MLGLARETTPDTLSTVIRDITAADATVDPSQLAHYGPGVVTVSSDARAPWRAPRVSHDLEQITERWRLPAVYLDFVTRFSPLRVIIDGDMFVQTFLLFGAADLIKGQDGYSESSALKRRLEEWPPHLVVIGSDAGDPYVLDLSRSNGEDAPVLTAWHGTGNWDFQPVADSFMEFIELLAK